MEETRACVRTNSLRYNYTAVRSLPVQPVELLAARH